MKLSSHNAVTNTTSRFFRRVGYFTAFSLAILFGLMPDAWAAPSLKHHIYYYPWYGTSPIRHWNQNGHVPPSDISADFYPVLGAYSSADTGVIATHMSQIASCDVGVVVVSWWGQTSYENTCVPAILSGAQSAGLKVSFMIEPYDNRTPATTANDITYLLNTYGGHAAFFRDAERGNKPLFYVWHVTTYAASQWSPLASGGLNSNNMILAQTTDASYTTPAGGYFSGLFTYANDGQYAPGWAVAANFCQQNNLPFVPGTAPGYMDDSSARDGIGAVNVDRRNGLTYQVTWHNAMEVRPTYTGIISFNEWHEGSQIEPTSSAPPSTDPPYLTFSGAYGTTGTASQAIYLTQTKKWVDLMVDRNVNASFENASGWILGANFSRATDKPHAGAWSLKSGASAGSAATVTWPIPVEANTLYQLSGWIWRTNTAGYAYLDMNDVAGEAQTATASAGSWQYVSGIWNSGPTPPATVRLRCVSSAITGAVWYDEVKLTKVSDHVRNSSFETAGATGWTLSSSHSRANDRSCVGDWSLKSNFIGAGGAASISDPIPVTPNTNYVVYGYVFRPSTTTQGNFSIDMNDIGGELTVGSSVGITNQWQFVSGTWNSGANPPASIRLRCISDGSPNGPGWFDAVRFYKQP